MIDFDPNELFKVIGCIGKSFWPVPPSVPNAQVTLGALGLRAGGYLALSEVAPVVIVGGGVVIVLFGGAILAIGIASYVKACR